MNEAKRAYDILRGYVNTEWDRIRGVDWNDAWRELQTSTTPPPSPTARLQDVSAPIQTPEETARVILGVTVDDDFEVIRRAFETLNRRTQPAQFAAGSSEEHAAANLQTRIHWAYNLLTNSVPSSEKRFKSLEIE